MSYVLVPCRCGCQSTSLIVLVPQQKCVKCKDGKVPCRKGNAKNGSQSRDIRWRQDAVIFWLLSLRYQWTSHSFYVFIYFWSYYSDILEKKDEERHFHSSQREAWTQRSQMKGPRSLQCLIFPGFRKRPPICPLLPYSYRHTPLSTTPQYSLCSEEQI